MDDIELFKCNDCRVWDPENQPSVMQNLIRDPKHYADKVFMFVKTGQELYGAPLSVELMLCDKHSNNS